MGQGLFEEVPEYAPCEPEVDAILGYFLRKLCLEDAENRLKETQFTQPSLYVFNALHHYKAVSQGAWPDYVTGHSLGEYNALPGIRCHGPKASAFSFGRALQNSGKWAPETC